MSDGSLKMLESPSAKGFAEVPTDAVPLSMESLFFRTNHLRATMMPNN